MAEQSPTDDGSVQNSSGEQNTPQLDEDQHNSADEQQDIDSGEDNSSDSDSGSSSNKKDDDQSSDDDDGLAKFAKGQGFDDISDFTERELDLLRRQKKQVDKFRNDPERIKGKDELRTATEEINDPSQVEDVELSDDEKREARRDLEIAQLRAAQRTRDFYDRKPEARDYDKEMGEVIKEMAKRNGPAVARAFAQNLDDVLALAKARRGEDDSEAAREAGRKAERELLRKRSEGSADTAHSTQTSTPKRKITREWLATEYNPADPEQRKLVDEAMARGDLN
jgi:hypothetical protein